MNNRQKKLNLTKTTKVNLKNSHEESIYVKFKNDRSGVLDPLTGKVFVFDNGNKKYKKRPNVKSIFTSGIFSEQEKKTQNLNTKVNEKNKRSSLTKETFEDPSKEDDDWEDWSYDNLSSESSKSSKNSL
jgi:hypothetical protein